MNSPEADKSYQEAPHKRKVTLLLGNVLFMGPQGSGKTSLIRSLTGEAFRLMEPLSSSIAIDDGYHAISDSLDWSSTTAGLMYEDELVKIIVEDLLKHALSHPLNGRSEPRLLPPVAITPNCTPPPLPPRRVHSFSEAHGRSTLSSSTELASHRLSGSYETIDSVPSNSGYRPQPLANNEGRGSPKLSGLARNNRKHLLGKLSSSFRAKGHAARTDVRRTNSDTCQREPLVELTTPDTPPPPYESSIPEQLIEKIKSSLRASAEGTLPTKHFGKIIDTPGIHCEYYVIIFCACTLTCRRITYCLCTYTRKIMCC